MVTEKAYVGVLFLLGGAACAVLALRLRRRADSIAWALGAVTAAAMALGFLASRTVGLPDFHPSDWELSGVLSLLLEAGFVALAWSAVRQTLAGAEHGAGVMQEAGGPSDSWPTAEAPARVD